MTPKQIDLVEIGYHTAMNMREGISAAFFERLFELDPDFRDLFEDDLRDRASWLIAALGNLVGNIHSAGATGGNGPLPAGDGAENTILEYHFFTVGGALLWALEDSLGRLFSPAMEEAWAAAFYSHSTGMFPPLDEMREAA
jgi:nitric oxide dioxygenase